MYTAEEIRDLKIPVQELNNTDGCDVYVDGADEVTEHLAMIKGGGAALTPESRHLVRVYRRWRTQLARLSDRAFADAMRGPARKRTG